MDRESLAVKCEITADGGALHLAARDPGNPQAREALGNYTRTLEGKLRTNDSMPLSILVPAKPDLAQALGQAGGVVFTVEPEGAGGACVRFVASSQESRSRVHDFLKAAGGENVIRIGGRGADHPGNNLGWDARKDSDLSK